MNKAIIIGAGISGIAAAIRLSKLGFEVEVFEVNDHPGGKLTSFTKDGYRFDAGPSLFTMPNLVEELFLICGEEPEQYFQYKRKKTVCNYFWEDGTRFSKSGKTEKFIKETAEKFHVSEETLRSYLNASRKKYELTAPLFLEKSLHKLKTYFSVQTAKALALSGSLDIFSNLNMINENKLKEPHLVQLFNRYATYNGSSPYQTSGIMSMIPHLEMNLGTYFPKGGMISITNSLFKLAKRQGVKFHFNKAVEEIITKKGSAIGIRTREEAIEADLIVSNMDIFSTYKRLLPKAKHPKRILEQERSSSALIFYWGINKQFPELDLHNIIFSSNYKNEFENLFDQKAISEDPTIYINITGKEASEDAPKGCENWFVMINTPGDYGQDWEIEISAARKNIIKKINRTLEVKLENMIESESILDPRLIESKTSSYRGSLYGASSNSKFAAFLRHPNFSGKFKNLYFCGGSVHPGGGIPLCLQSAKIVQDLVSEDYKIN